MNAIAQLMISDGYQHIATNAVERALEVLEAAS
jgi:hypothetical protein